MQGNDLGSWTEESIILILEGILCTPSFSGLRKNKLVDPERWDWQLTPLKRLSTMATQNISVDIVTFMGQDVADAAAGWMEKYDIDYGAIEACDFDNFTRTLIMRKARSVYDSDYERFQRYGQIGVLVQRGQDYV